MIPVLSASEFVQALAKARTQPVSYRAMYSSWLGGIVTDPSLMIVPLDDHLVHRGDGIFEAFRIVDAAIYDLDGHMARLEKSAQAIALELPMSQAQIRDVIIETAETAGLTQGMVRLYISRGPGSFSPNPYESVGSQLYVVATEFKPTPEEVYAHGTRVMVSQVPAKENFYSQIKSCNYLPNVLMKKETVDAKMDFAVAVNAQQKICEGPTENICLLTKSNELRVPKFDYTLRGTTLLTLIELVKEHMPQIRSVEFADLTVADFKNAKEAFMVGTTLEVLPIREFAGQLINERPADGYGVEMRRLLQNDMKKNTKRRTALRITRR